MDDKTLVSTEHARTAEYFAYLEAAAKRGECPFCTPARFPADRVLRTTEHFRLVRNDFPYQHHMEHLLIIPIEHIEMQDFQTVPASLMTEVWEILVWATREFELPGGGLVLRFGDPDFNASTVRHLHWHIQAPDGSGAAKATFAKDQSPEAIAARAAKIAAFRVKTQEG